MKTVVANRRSMAAGIAGLFLGAAALADVPRLVHYQGKLVTNVGAIVAGPVSLRARLYDSPTNGSPILFDETHSGVALNRGLFSILLGSQTGGGVPDSVLAGETLYLGVSVDGASELSPRIRIATAPFAAKTRAAEKLVRPNTATTAVRVDASGDVGIDGRLIVGGGAPEASARVDIQSTTQGFLVPRMTAVQRDAIASPAAGLQIFNTDTRCYNMWDGSTWRQSCFECTFSPPTAGNNGPICEGETLNLSATQVVGAIYLWTGPNGFSSTDQNPSVPNTTTAASGPYSVTATVDGCTSNPVTTLASVGAIPSAPTVGSNSPVCAGQTLTLNSTNVPGAIYSWSGPNGFTSNLEDPSIPNVTTAASGMYSLTVTVNGCMSAPSTTSATVNESPSTPGSINGQTTFCGAVNGQVFSITDVPGATTYTWTVPSGSSIAAGQGTAFLTVNVGTQDGNITVTAGNACGTSGASTLGIAQGCPASCDAILAGNPSAPSGVYSIDPDGAGGNAAFPALCDMTTDGGGWTLVANYVAGSSAPNRTQTDAFNLSNWSPGFADGINGKFSDTAINALANLTPGVSFRWYTDTSNPDVNLYALNTRTWDSDLTISSTGDSTPWCQNLAMNNMCGNTGGCNNAVTARYHNGSCGSGCYQERIWGAWAGDFGGTQIEQWEDNCNDPYQSRTGWQ